MADPNAVQDNKKEERDTRIKTRMDEIRERIKNSGVQERVKERIQKIQERYNTDIISKADRKYLNTLPSDYKNKALRYLDIFKENPKVV